MRNVRCVIFLLLGSLPWALFHERGLCDETVTDLIQLVSKEAPKRWQEYIQNMISTNLSGGYTETLTRSAKIVAESKASLTDEYTSDFACMNLMWANDLKENGKKIHEYCSNKKYVFKVSPAEHETWKINTLDKRTGDIVSRFDQVSDTRNISPVEMQLSRYFYDRLCQGLYLSHSFLPALFEQPEFKIESIKRVDEGSDNVIRVNFSYKPKPSHYLPLVMNISTGEFDLLPDHCYLVKRGNVAYVDDEPYTVEFVNDYDFNGEIPLLIRRQTQSFEQNAAKTPQIKREISLVYGDIGSISPARFTLSHYGIPEPDFGERRVNRLRYILMTIGGLMIAFALWQIYQKRKEQTS